MEKQKLTELAVFAEKVRLAALEGIYNAASGHPGGSLSIADVVTYLYNCEMRIRPDQPDWEDRDRFVLSKGHCAPAVYAALGLKGYFDVKEVANLRKLGHFLQGHPDMKGVPGVDMSTGSLGQGISAACGMALAAKLDGRDYRVYTILGDGESQEGQVYEALMFAAHYKLDNLVVMIDYNGLQIDGDITKVMSPLPFADKFRAFNFNVFEADGHDFESIAAALDAARAAKGKPSGIILRTVKGKGVSFMENNPAWHGSAPKQEQYEIAKAELEARLEAAQQGELR